MAKIPLENFNNGLITEQDRNIPAGHFFSGLGVELYNAKGYIMPGPALSDVTPPSLTTQAVDIINDEINGNAYILSTGAKVFRLNNIGTTPTVDINVDGSAHDYFAVTGMVGAAKGIIFNYNGTNNLYWAYNNSTAGYLGRSRLTGTFGGGSGDSITFETLSSVADVTVEKDIIEWNGAMFITSGRYIDKSIGSGSPTTAFFDLGVGMTSTCLFTTPNYLGIFHTRKPTNGLGYTTKATLIDGSSGTAAVKVIPLEGVRKVYCCRNLNGEIHFWANLGKTAHAHCLLTNNGYQVISNLTHDISGTNTDLTVGGGTTGYNNQAIDIFDNRILYGIGNYGLVFSYGKQPLGKAEILSMPFYLSTTANTAIHSIRACATNLILLGVIDASGNYKIKYLKFKDTSYGTATFKGGYIDFTQQAKILFVDFFFRPLASGDSATVSVDYDYGTAGTIKDPLGNTTIAFSTDGAITRKRFKFGEDVHAVRPVINWTSGSMKVSKIIITNGSTPDDF